MAVLPILQLSNPAEEAILRQKAKRVSRLDGRLQRLIDDMLETMHDAHGVGLAAPQVGVSLRIIVIEIPSDYDGPHAGERHVMYNPELVRTVGEWEPEEGCLSFPGYVANVKRSQKVVVKGRDRQGRELRVRAEALLAQAFQHEIDHLNGVLFLDHLESLDLLRRVIPKTEQPEPAPVAGL
ncbi:MAG: peptide deformylase [Chloroflexi bacterium]|nr:peptide deformylase [Chloroflexota bacterium]